MKNELRCSQTKTEVMELELASTGAIQHLTPSFLF